MGGSHKVIEGGLSGEGLRVGIVVSRFNATVTERLLEGALDTLRQWGVQEEAMEIAKVPGSFEIPLVAKKMAQSGRFDALICLGAVIRGETPHFEYIASQVASGIAQVSLTIGLPIAFGVLTTETVRQAMERARVKGRNKGKEAALAAIEMANLLRKIK